MIQFLDLKKITALHYDELHEALTRTLRSGWFLKGEETATFERLYAQFTGTSHCVGCGNGLDALTLIMRAYIELGVMKPGDEVIVPANTYIASVLAVSRNNLKPVLVEADIDTLQMDDSKIEEAITPRTKAIMIVHLYGKCAYTDTIGRLCKHYGLKLIEDNAQAHGCRYGGRRTGSLGDAAAHSFYPTKNIGTAGDAGAVTTDDAVLAEMVRGLANYGSAKKYIFSHIGINSRMDELHAAILTVKLKYIDAENEQRRDNARFYINNVSNRNIKLPSHEYWESSVFHIFPILCDRRDELKDYLLRNGVQTDVHYPVPPHKQECYKELAALSFPVTERIHREELSIPVSQILEPEERETIARLINQFR